MIPIIYFILGIGVTLGATRGVKGSYDWFSTRTSLGVGLGVGLGLGVGVGLGVDLGVGHGST